MTCAAVLEGLATWRPLYREIPDSKYRLTARRGDWAAIFVRGTLHKPLLVFTFKNADRLCSQKMMGLDGICVTIIRDL